MAFSRKLIFKNENLFPYCKLYFSQNSRYQTYPPISSHLDLYFHEVVLEFFFFYEKIFLEIGIINFASSSSLPASKLIDHPRVRPLCVHSGRWLGVSLKQGGRSTLQRWNSGVALRKSHGSELELCSALGLCEEEKPIELSHCLIQGEDPLVIGRPFQQQPPCLDSSYSQPTAATQAAVTRPIP